MQLLIAFKNNLILMNKKLLSIYEKYHFIIITITMIRKIYIPIYLYYL
mgnify:CR=1 FL=1